jgi:hypothetical protein
MEAAFHKVGQEGTLEQFNAAMGRATVPRGTVAQDTRREDFTKVRIGPDGTLEQFNVAMGRVTVHGCTVRQDTRVCRGPRLRPAVDTACAQVVAPQPAFP